jgi:hypothetical protein
MSMLHECEETGDIFFRLAVMQDKRKKALRSGPEGLFECKARSELLPKRLPEPL